MPRITLETKKKIGNIYKIYEETFELPDMVFYLDSLFYWDSAKKVYTNPHTDFVLTPENYIKSEIIRNSFNAEQDEME